MAGQGRPEQSDRPSPERTSQTRSLARDLTGDLGCARCGYNLRGLSIRAACPECALPVRTTILALVDPKAEELTPLTMPRLTAWGVVAWVGGALLASVCVWLLRLDEILDRLSWGGGHLPVGRLVWLGIGGLVVSGVSAIVLFRPHRRVPSRHRALTVMGVLLYAPLIWVFWNIHARLDTMFAQPYTNASPYEMQRAAMRLCFGAISAIIILALRPSARALAARSHIFRTGQIDRQSFLGLVVAFGIAASGDVLSLVMGGGITTAEFLHAIEIALVTLGSFLITVGLFAAFVDAVRLRPVLSSASFGLSHLLESNVSRDERLGELGP